MQLVVRRIEVYSKWTENLLKYFSLFGFHSIPLLSCCEKSMNLLIFAIQIVVCLFCTICTFYAFIESKSIMSFLDAINFFLYYLSCAFTYWLIIFDSYTNQTVEFAFWKHFYQFTERIKCRPIISEKLNFLHVFFLLLIFDAIVFIYALLYETASSAMYKSINFIFSVVFEHRLFFYYLHMKVVAYGFHDIETMAISLRLQQKFFTQNFEPLLEIRCKRIREHFGLLKEMVDAVNKAFQIWRWFLWMCNCL